MKSSRIVAPMSRKRWITLLLILLTTSNSEGQEGIPSAGLLCVSKCETCPVVCSSPPPCPPKSPQPPPPPAAATHHSPPEEPPSHSSPPPPPELYVYSPGKGPGMVQQNFSYPYYYFYSSEAVTCSLWLHQGFFLFVLFMFFQILLAFR